MLLSPSLDICSPDQREQVNNYISVPSASQSDLAFRSRSWPKKLDVLSEITLCDQVGRKRKIKEGLLIVNRRSVGTTSKESVTHFTTASFKVDWSDEDK